MTSSWPLVSSDVVRADVLATLKAWLPAAVLHVADLEGGEPDDVKRPDTTRGWRTPVGIDDLWKAELPLVAVAVLGGDVERDRAPDTVDMRWQVQARAWVRGRDYEDTAQLASWYATAMAAVIDQQRPGDGARVTGVEFIPVADDTNSRVTAEVHVDADVWQCDVHSLAVFPATPPEIADPYESLPEAPVASEVSTTVEPEAEE